MLFLLVLYTITDHIKYDAYDENICCIFCGHLRVNTSTGPDFSLKVISNSWADVEKGGGGGMGVRTPLENHKWLLVSSEILVQTPQMKCYMIGSAVAQW